MSWSALDDGALSFRVERALKLDAITGMASWLSLSIFMPQYSLRIVIAAVMANVINACKDDDLETLSQKVLMLLVFLKTYHSLLPLCLIALDINAR
ncbi:uncharacterized protein V6R79_004269 [Siganus canaliculatus]